MSDDELDPRVQIELERLNEASEDINRLENKLDELNALFRSTLSAGAASLHTISGRLGGAVQRARPYYETLSLSRSAQLQCQRAAVQFQRATVLHKNARDTIELAESRFLSTKTHAAGKSPPSPDTSISSENATQASASSVKKTSPGGESAPHFDGAWQEMLNHATMRLLEAEQLKVSSEHQHRLRAQAFVEFQTKLQKLERSLGRSVRRARVYFDQRQIIQDELFRQKEQLQQTQARLATAKSRYNCSLQSLESISEDVHHRRQQRQSLREASRDAKLELPDCRDPSAADLFSEISESATSDYTEDFRLSQEQQYWSSMREQLEAISDALSPIQHCENQPSRDLNAASSSTPRIPDETFEASRKNIDGGSISNNKVIEGNEVSAVDGDGLAAVKNADICPDELASGSC